MAVSGQRPKPAALKLVTGNPGKRALPEAPADVQRRTEPLLPPKRLTKHQQRLWARFIDTAWWLTDHDVAKAYVWVRLQSAFESSADMTASMISQLRNIGSELGLDPVARARMAIDGPKSADPADKFFG